MLSKAVEDSVFLCAHKFHVYEREKVLMALAVVIVELLFCFILN